MRLLIATPLYPPEPGGPATYAKLLEEGLPGLGIEVTLVKFSDVRHLPRFIRHVAYFKRLLRDGRNADAILVLDPVSTGLPAALAARVMRKPLVLKVVGDYAWEQGRQRFGVTLSLDDFARTGRVPFIVGILRSIETWVARQARLVLVPSAYLKRIVTLWGISDAHIAVVPNAVHLTIGGRVHGGVAGLPHPRIVTVARLVPWKGIDGLIEAVCLLRRKGVEASLVVIGEGPERKNLEALARTQLHSHVLFTGAESPETVHATLRESDVFVLNSTYEGLSHVLIEALMAGLPVIATDAGGNSEVITPESGILVPVGNTKRLAETLEHVLTDPRLRTSLEEGALLRAEAFTVEAMLERTKTILTTL